MVLQALVAMAEVSNEICHEGSCGSVNVKPLQYKKFLVISLGTGSQTQEMRYSAAAASNWGIVGWVTNSYGNPLIDAFSHASSDMVDFHISSVFQARRSEHNYLRIQVLSEYKTICNHSHLYKPKLMSCSSCVQILQDDTLTGDLSSVDMATEKNLKGLVQVAEELLKKPVSKINLMTGIHEPADSHETNADALKRYLYILYKR